MKKLISCSAIAVILILFGAFAPGYAKKPVQLTMVTYIPDVSPGNTWFHIFMDKVAEKSNGELSIRWIGGPEAIPMPDAPAAVQRGVVDIGSTIATFAETMVPGIEAIELAEYGPEEMRTRGAVEFINELFAKQGLHFLGYASPSDAQEQARIFSRKEIKSIADFKGMKIAAAGGSNSAFLAALGATTIPIAFPDFFTALERGAVDGYFIAQVGIVDHGLAPVTKFAVDENIASSGTFFLMNLKKYNSLPEHLKTALNEAAAEADREGTIVSREMFKGIDKTITQEGVKIVKLPHDESVEFYRLYRESMSDEAMKRNPEMVTKLLKLIRNPDFHRLK